MPTEVQFRRGTTAQNNSFTGAAGELSVNTDNNSLRIHDGSTAGGFELAKSDLSNSVGTGGTVFAANVGIGTTIVITSGFKLQNIQSLDATTTATIESAVAAAPNNFTSLSISGIGTIVGEFNVGTGGTVLTGLSQAGISSVGINNVTPTATLDVTGNANISQTVTAVGGNITGVLTAVSAVITDITGGLNCSGIVTATTFDGEIAGAAVTTNSTGLHVVGVATVLNLNTTNVTVGVITATTFDGELVGSAVTTSSSGLVQNTGIASIAQIVGNLNGSVISGLTTVTDTFTVSGVSTLGGPIAFAGLSTFYTDSKHVDNAKALFGLGGDLEIYHNGSNSFIADVGGGSLQLNATPDIRFLNNSTGIGTIGAGGLDIAGGTHIGVTGITTVSEIKIGAAVTAASSGLDALNVNVGTALTVVGVSTMSGLVNVGVDTSVGVVMTAANGTRYRLFVENDGSLTTIALS